MGAGPAGLFAAHELAGEFDVTVVEMGRGALERECPVLEEGFCRHCPTCEITHGVGGAGCMSDGKLNLNPLIGGDLTEYVSPGEAQRLVDMVDQVFARHGAPEPHLNNRCRDLRQTAASHGIEFVPIKQRHVGSDKLPQVIHGIRTELEEKGVRFKLNTRVEDVLARDDQVRGVRLDDDTTLEADFVVIAPGRAGSPWLTRVCHDLDVPLRYLPIDVGVRVEVPAVIYEDVTEINWDPKFRIRTPSYDDMIRTFCTCPNGFVVRDTYDAAVGVNGHSMREKQSSNTNFAFLVRVELTEPVEDTSAYGQSIATLANTIGGGQPILQRLGDLRRGRRSTWDRVNRSYVNPTLQDVTPGDISMAMPSRVVKDVLEGLEMLDTIVPGVASDSTLLYAPEIKFSAMRVEVDEAFQTNIRGLYAAGDGAGLSGDIVNAAATGILAARGIKNNG